MHLITHVTIKYLYWTAEAFVAIKHAQQDRKLLIYLALWDDTATMSAMGDIIKIKHF